MLVKEWLREFLLSEIGYEPDGDQWKQWLRVLIDVKATKAHAEIAAGQLRQMNVPLELDVLAVQIRAVQNGTKATPPSDKAQAEAASRSCKHCGGSGQAMIYHPLYDGNPTRKAIRDDGTWTQTAARVVAHCVCPMGRWLRERTDKDVIKRIPDFQLAIDGKLFSGGHCWLSYDPCDDSAIGPCNGLPRDWRERILERSRV
jgi:hypothetical protein